MRVLAVLAIALGATLLLLVPVAGVFAYTTTDGDSDWGAPLAVVAVMLSFLVSGGLLAFVGAAIGMLASDARQRGGLRRG